MKINVQKRRRLILLLLMSIITLAVSGLTTNTFIRADKPVLRQTRSNQEISPLATTANSPNCRYGVTPLGNDQVPWVDTLGVGWYINFNTDEYATLPDNGAEFVPVIPVNQAKNGSVYLDDYTVGRQGLTGAAVESYLQSLVTSNPGRLWLIGNEVEGPIGQGDIHPDVYARAYHDIYGWIKQYDPTAQVAIGGLSMMTPGRLQYLDIVWETYLQNYGTMMPVDVWNFHVYILAEYNPYTGSNAEGKVALGTDQAIAKITYGGVINNCLQDQVYCRAEHDSISIFQEQVRAMRTWMKEHGQQNKPLILSEYNLLFPFVDYDDPINPTQCFLMDEYGQCFTAARVNAYMDDTFSFLESSDAEIGYPNDNYRLVQQWMWFSLATGLEDSGGSSNLLKVDPDSNGDGEDEYVYVTYPDGHVEALTDVGLNFYDEVTSLTTYVNLMAGEADKVIGYTAAPSTTTTVTLSVDLYNNGNMSLDTPFQVTFYEDEALSQAIGSVTINPILLGCARHTYTASVDWSDLGPGVHPYWVKVDSGDLINESNPGKSDNTTSGFVLVDPESIFLPVITRSLPGY